MRECMEKKKYDKILYVLPAFLALVIVFVGLYYVFAEPPAFKEHEKEYRKEFPAFTSESFFSGKWGQDFEEFLADKMPGRNFLVGVNAYFDLLTGRQNTGDIWRDEKGNLIEAPVKVDIEPLKKNLGKMVDFAENTGLDTALIIPTTAGYVDRELLKKAEWECYTDNEIIKTIHETFLGKASFIDISEEFISCEEQLFYRTDHHWNEYGAYIAYENICGYFGIETKPFEEFDISYMEGFYGSTYSRSGLWLTKSDTIALLDPGVCVKVRFSDAEGEWDSLFFTEKYADMMDKYPVFLDGNHPVTYVENLEAEEERTLIMIKDSYAMSLVPMLIGHYSDIVLVDLRYYKQPVSELASEVGASQALIVYSPDHLVNDTNIIWLR
ncbi:MAG: hypothetical protein E7334_07670 [Clostridiales bacterium]|nr:hypothetical protein [Clostridiales bacterium]